MQVSCMKIIIVTLSLQFQFTLTLLHSLSKFWQQSLNAHLQDNAYYVIIWPIAHYKMNDNIIINIM